MTIQSTNTMARNLLNRVSAGLDELNKQLLLSALEGSASLEDQILSRKIGCSPIQDPQETAEKLVYAFKDYNTHKNRFYMSVLHIYEEQIKVLNLDAYQDYLEGLNTAEELVHAALLKHL